MPPLKLIAWPYHAGLEDVGMGAGPGALVEDHEFLAALGHPDVDFVPPVDESQPEIARIFELDRRLAGHVRATSDAGRFPLVLGGNCVSCLGTTAGVGATDGELGVVWFDAHADFDTSDDNLSGFTDVMGLAIQTGTGWRALRETIPGFTPVPEGNVVLAGVRDLEPYQRERVDGSQLRTVPGPIDGDDLRAALDDLRRESTASTCTSTWTWSTRARPAPTPSPQRGAPRWRPRWMRWTRCSTASRSAAAAITAYDPTVDPRAAAAATQAAARIAGRAGA